MLVALAGLLMSTLVVAPAADAKGKWDGLLTVVREDGAKKEDTALLILDQKGGTITGTVGGSETDQHPITSGTIDGNKVVIVATPANGREVRLEMTLEGDAMQGTISRGTLTGQIQVKRRKE